MRKVLLGTVFLLTAAVMMGCGDAIVPCVDDAECVIEGPGPEIPMVCNLEVTPQERCEQMYGWLDNLPIPIELPIPIPDCSDLEEYPDSGGVCEISLESPF
jgi:hypothetical protein